MQQRLQKCISEAGVASRRTAEAMISAMSNPASRARRAPLAQFSMTSWIWSTVISGAVSLV